jgi:hypothetical protein
LASVTPGRSSTYDRRASPSMKVDVSSGTTPVAALGCPPASRASQGRQRRSAFRRPMPAPLRRARDTAGIRGRGDDGHSRHLCWKGRAFALPFQVNPQGC